MLLDNDSQKIFPDLKVERGNVRLVLSTENLFPVPIYSVSMCAKLSGLNEEEFFDLLGRHYSNDYIDSKILRLREELCSERDDSNSLDRREQALGQKNMSIIALPQNMTTQEIITWLDEIGFRPGTFEELFSLGIAHPELQKEYTINALGSGVYDSGTKGVFLAVPCLDCNPANIPGIGFIWKKRELQWSKNTHFLALPQ